MPDDSDVQQIIVSATYADEVAARADFERLVEFRKAAQLEHVHAALLVRDSTGELRVEQHSFETNDVAGVGAVVGIVAGATLAAIFPPLGLAVAAAALAGGVGGALVGGAVGAAIGHLEGGVSKQQVEDIGRVLRSGQAALVVSSDASRAADLHDFLRDADITQSVDIAGASVDEAYEAVGRALASESADVAHAAAAVQLDVRVLLDYAGCIDRAGGLSASEQQSLSELADTLSEQLAAHAPSTTEQAAMDKANAVLAGLSKRAKSVGIDGAPLVELDRIASAFNAADRLARSFYVAASSDIPAPAPRPTELELIDAGSRAALSLHVSEDATRTLTDEHTPHVFEAVGATPAEKAAITRGAHVASDVSARWSNDIALVVTKVRDTLGVTNR